MKTHQKLHNISSYITNQLKLLFVTGILLLPSVAWLLTKPVIASAATPDSCFEFDGGTITDYYDYEGMMTKILPAQET